MSNTSTSAVVGKVIGTLIQTGLTVWSMLETDGLIHGVLIGYLALLAVIFIAHSVVAVAKAESKPAQRPIFGDVRVNALDGDRR